ncbi:MAG: Ig-like domain-containing protein [Rhodoferax sp.]|nr:Ig-like domain-containing protein [Rhodoferax sp.]
MRFLSFLMVYLMAGLLAACGGGGGSGGLIAGIANDLLTTAPSSITVGIGTSQSFTIMGGKGNYTATSSSVQVAVAAVTDSTLTIGGVASGSASIQVSDSNGSTTTITVTVGNLQDLFTTAPSSISLATASESTYTIGGGVPGYTVSTNNARIATASITNGNLLRITALASGSATITVRDANAHQISISVVVSNFELYTTAPSSFIITKDTQRTFQVGGGVPIYTVESVDTRIATARLSGNALIVSGVAAGNTTIIVRDSDRQTTSFFVTVSGDTPVPLFTTAPNPLTVALKSTSSFAIGGGVAPYTLVSNDVRVATAFLTGNTMTINALALGDVSLTLRDSAGTTLSIPVTVSTLAPAQGDFFTGAPTDISMSPGSVMDFPIGGGTKPYTARSSDTRVASASVSDTSLTINAGTIGEATVQVTDATGKTLSVSVTVTSSAPGTFFTTAPSPLSMTTGTSLSFQISGGTQPYMVTSNDSRVVSGSANGTSLTVTAGIAGTAALKLSDATGQTIQVAVTVDTGVVSLPLFTTAPSALTVAVSANPVTYSINGGVAPYTAVSSDSSVAIASASGTSGQFLDIRGIASGSATVTIRDARGSVLTVAVTVPAPASLFSTAPSPLIMAIGDRPEYLITGGSPISGGSAPYNAQSSNPAVATAVSGANGKLTITALGVGAANIVISDAKGNTLAVAVTVQVATALGTTAPPTLTLVNGSTSDSYAISGGVPYSDGYRAVSNNPAVVAVVMNTDNRSFSITARSSGAASVFITDSRGGSTTVAVTVPAAGSPTALFTTAPSPLQMAAGTSQKFQIGGGSAPYTVNSQDTRLATGNIIGSELTISAIAKGTVALRITDATGTVLSLTVTVDGTTGAAGPASIDILPSSTTLNSASGSKMTFIVTVKNANNLAVPNQAVAFTASSGFLTGASPAPSTDATGTVSTVSLSPGSDSSNRIIKVTASSGNATKSIDIPVTGTTLDISGAGSALASSTTSIKYSVKALDSSGKPLSGASLSVASKLGNGISPQTVSTNTSGTAEFQLTPSNEGIDTLTVSGLGTSKTKDVQISKQDFQLTNPKLTDVLPVNRDVVVSVLYRDPATGAAVKNVPITFSTTRGTPAQTTVSTDNNGVASTVIRSNTTGPVTISAQSTLGARDSMTTKFVSVTPSQVKLQASPSAVLPNALGSTTNQSTLTATVRDSFLNPVEGVVVNFTAIKDLSNGSLVPSSATTDASGLASVQFIAGPLQTEANGVQIQASVQGSSSPITDTTTLTVNGSALFIAIGQSNAIIADASTPTIYEKEFSVYVTDANGVASSNRAITISVYPKYYGKGYLEYNKVLSQWVYAFNTRCANEDVNRNGIFDAGEDVNGDGILWPGLPVIISASNLTTDSNGYGSFKMRYGKNYAWWLDTQITAKALVSGTESSITLDYSLEMVATDAKSENSPPNQTSPFKIATSCTNPN